MGYGAVAYGSVLDDWPPRSGPGWTLFSSTKGTSIHLCWPRVRQVVPRGHQGHPSLCLSEDERQLWALCRGPRNRVLCRLLQAPWV